MFVSRGSKAVLLQCNNRSRRGSESLHSASLSIQARGTGTGGSPASGTVSRRPPGGPERKTIWRKVSQKGPVGIPGMAGLDASPLQDQPGKRGPGEERVL